MLDLNEWRSTLVVVGGRVVVLVGQVENGGEDDGFNVSHFDGAIFGAQNLINSP